MNQLGHPSVDGLLALRAIAGHVRVLEDVHQDEHRASGEIPPIVFVRPEVEVAAGPAPQEGQRPDPCRSRAVRYSELQLEHQTRVKFRSKLPQRGRELKRFSGRDLAKPGRRRSGGDRV